MGLTDNFMRVAVAAEENPAGTMQDVTITGTADGLAVGRFAAASHSSSLLLVTNR
jgi:hypothetical protein